MTGDLLTPCPRYNLLLCFFFSHFVTASILKLLAKNIHVDKYDILSIFFISLRDFTLWIENTHREFPLFQSKVKTRFSIKKNLNIFSIILMYS